MVTTRRKAAEPAQPSHAAPAASTEQVIDEAPVTLKKTRRKVTARTPSAPRTVAPTVTTTKATAVATTTTSTSTAATTTVAAARRTRSKQTDSPLKSLEDIQQQATASSAKAPAVKATPLKTKRKYGASHYDKIGRSATPEQPATPAQEESNDDEGIFFTQSNQRKSLSLIYLTPPPIHQSIGAGNDSDAVGRQNDPVAAPHPTNHVFAPEYNEPVRVPEQTESVPVDSPSLLNNSFAFLNDDAYMHEAFTCHQDDTVLFSEGDPVTPHRESAGPLAEPGSPYVSPSPSTYATHVPTWVRVSAEVDAKFASYPQFSGYVSTDNPLEAQLREENYYLRAELKAVQDRNFRLHGDNIELKSRSFSDASKIARLKQLLPPSPPPPQAYWSPANKVRSEIETFGMNDRYGEGNTEAFDLLDYVTNSAKETHTISHDSDDDSDVDMQSSHQPEQQITESETARKAAEATPVRTISKPSFLTRSISAIKSRIGWSTPTPTQPSPAPTSTSRAPQPDSYTELLSTPPTPVGERRQARPRKQKRNLMLQLLTKGVEPGDMVKAQEWAKHMIPTLKNYLDFPVMRQRLEKPVLLQDLEQLPSSKPWESGFGDPLGHLDDEDVVPVWAVVLEIVSEQEQPMRKRTKASHEVSMGLDDTLSLNDMDRATEPLHDSHGHSASLMDLHPRRSVEPSPIFTSSPPYQSGSNVFKELRGHESSTEFQADEHKVIQEVTKEATHTHNPSQGSFGLDYGSDESEDESISLEGETSDADNTASPLWTQPPPPAPVPAHAPLPGGSAAGTPAAAEAPSTTTEQPKDEIERQRQKLMKHTPAKPSRLREAFVPSPSVLSDAGNQSFLTGTPLAPTSMFGDMPDAEDLDLTSEDWVGVRALTNSDEWKAAAATNVWPDPTYTYASEEEELSPV